jgi:peptide/nickel transport system permease protein
MWEYILKRLLWFIPTLILVTLLGFLLLVSAPGDPLDQLVPALSSKNADTYKSQRAYWTKQLGLDLPVFYFSVKQWSEPDDLYKMQDPLVLKAYKNLLNQTGNAEFVNAYFETIRQSRWLYERSLSLEKEKFPEHYQQVKSRLHTISEDLDALERTGNSSVQVYLLTKLKQSQSNFLLKLPSLSAPIEKSLQQLKANKTRYKNYIPKITWYGSHNRYHLWLFGNGTSKGVIRGDFGMSYSHKEPVLAVISDKMIWSLFFSIVSILLAYLISIPIGMRLAQKPDALASRITQAGLFLLYSMPVFFGGVLLLMLFANPDVLSIFPPSGIKPIGGYADDANLFEKLSDSLPYIVLPLICYTYSSFSYISRLTQSSLMEQLPLDYIKTARAKGLSDRAIIRNHALRNSLLPLITVFSAVFPSTVGGSVIIESIFTIPGMGLETVKAIMAKDYPIVIAVITLSCLLTMLSYLIADILYAWADPRIRHKS